MPELTIDTTGIEDLQRRLKVDLSPFLALATRAIAEEVKTEIAPYPPATVANQKPGWFVIGGGLRGNKWYERGFGTRWLRRDGSVGGKKTSQFLGRRWAIKKSGRWGAILGNTADYAKPVHSKEDQASYHGERGWVTDEKAIERVQRSGKAQRILEQMTNDLLRKAGLI